MTLGLGEILKGATTSTNQKKMANFRTLKPTTSGISKDSIKRMKRLAQRDGSHGEAQVQGSRESGSLRGSAATRKAAQKRGRLTPSHSSASSCLFRLLPEKPEA